MVYQFTVHSNLPEGSACPIHPMFQLYGKLMKGIKLTTAENDYIVERLYGLFGQHSSTYKLGGFSASFFSYFPKVLVRQYGHWQAYYVPNKTALRKVLSGSIEEMVYVSNKKPK